MPHKGISPIIAIIIILLITIAIAGAGYSYISTYWSGLVGKEIQVVSTFCIGDNQGKVMVKNIGTNPLRTGEIAIINPLTGEDITQKILWSSQVSISDPSLVLELKFEEGSGTIAYDTSGKGNDGELLPLGTGPTWTNNGRVGSALSFDGNDDYVSCGNDPSLFPTSFIMVGAWLKLNALPNGVADISQHIAGGASKVYMRTTGSNRITFSVEATGGGSTATSTTALSVGQWHHLLGIYDGNVVKLYVNGVLESTSSPISGNINWGAPGAFQIGGWTGGTSTRVNGIIDELRIYNRVLSPEEIAVLAGDFPVQPGDTATLTHKCSGRCRYNLVLGGTAKEAMLEC